MIYTKIAGNKDKNRDDIKSFGETNKFQSPRMEARMHKVLFHKFIKDEYSIWIDGNVFLKHPEEYYYSLLGNKDIAVCQHSFIKSVFEEGSLCSKCKLDNSATIEEQLKKYEGFEQTGHAQTCMVIRRNTPEIRSLCEKWWAEICRYSVRDQISFPYIFRDKAKYLNIGLGTSRHDDNQYFKREKHLK